MRRTIRGAGWAPLALAGALFPLLAGCTSEPDPAPGPEPSSEPASESASAGVARRHFQLRYQVELRDLPPGEPLRLWVPLPGDDAHQTVRALTVDSPWPWRETRDPLHGNRILYVEATPTEAAARLTVTSEVERVEPIPSGPLALDAAGAEPPSGADEPWLRGSRLLVVDARLRELSRELAAGKASRLARARAFYDHVREAMVYDKSLAGWGRGDSVRACEVGHGNCTDYHAYFMALCLASGVPSRFEIGLSGPRQPSPAEVALQGYHCWAEVRRVDGTWFPVDASEADKDPSRAELFFGGLTPDRVTLGHGRDVVLEPPQAGEPLNYFVDPYAEVAGRPFAGVVRVAFWRDL